MSGSTGKTILISEPGALEYVAPFLPYMWAVLKSFYERHSNNGKAYEWLEPIFLNDDPETLLQPSQDVSIDVLGLSCYTWNWALQCSLAQRIKAQNPHCLVIAGGPDPDYKDPEFFRKYPFVDAIVVKDGEITFQKILDTFVQGERDFRDIGGLYLPAADGGEPIATGPAEIPTVFDYSPYIDQSPYYERLVARYGAGAFHATWETNRGCPYSCSFCDWGSSTMSKLRRFDLQRLEAELDWLGRMQVSYIMSADANFGILPRDVDLAELVNATHRTYGYPKMFHYFAAKNNPDRSIAIAQKFAETGVCPTHTLAIQHTRQEVLEATERSNIAADKQAAAAKTLMEEQIPIDVQLIVGIPGDTYALWKGCLGDLMEWGIHEDYDMYFYSLLPNAPAAEKSFQDKWQIETVDRYIFTGTIRAWKPGDIDVVRASKSRLVIQSKTYSSTDWIQMFTYGAFVKALHNASLTRLLALYLRLTHQVSYVDFYEGLIEEFFARTRPYQDWYQTVARCYQNFLEQENVRDRIVIEELPRYPYALDPSRWLSVQICLQLEPCFRALKAFLLARYPQAPALASLIDYQQQLIIVPTYDRNVGKTFPIEYDWPGYFAQTQGRTGPEWLDEPILTPGAVVRVSDQTCGEKGFLVRPLDWGAGDSEERWIAWIGHTVMHRNSAGKRNFRQLRLVTADAASADEGFQEALDDTVLVATAVATPRVATETTRVLQRTFLNRIKGLFK